MLCGLEAWRVTQIPRTPRRQSPGQPPGGPDGDEGDLLAGQRTAVLGAAYHGGTGPVGFAWVRDRAGGPVQVVAAGRALATMASVAGDQDVALKLPAGGRGQALDPGGLARMLTALPCWVQVAGVADSLLAAQAPQPAGPGRAAGPSLEDGLLAAWPGAFAWLVLAEPAGRAELEELTFGVYAAQGAAQRFDNPQAQLSVRRLQDRHAELRQAASAGLWRVRLLAGAAGGPEAAEVAGLLCASADLAGLPYGLVPVPGCGRLDRVLTAAKTPSRPGHRRRPGAGVPVLRVVGDAGRAGPAAGPGDTRQRAVRPAPRVRHHPRNQHRNQNRNRNRNPNHDQNHDHNRGARPTNQASPSGSC